MQPDGPQHQPLQSSQPGPTSVPGVKRSVDELPPSARGDAEMLAGTVQGNDGRGRRRWWPALAAAVAAVAIGITIFRGPMNDETESPNWPHVAAATQSAQQGESPMQWRSPGGTVDAASVILLTERDRDQATTHAIRDALAAGSPNRANELFRQAQQIPPPPAQLSKTAPQMADQAAEPAQLTKSDSELKSVEPSLSTGMREEIMRGDAHFFHIYLYDSCWNDGDIVEILIDGVPTFIVPITNQGATLSVPVSASGTTVVAVRGVFDGGGGITVACRTSQGDGFIRVMRPGEVQPLGVVHK